MQEISGENSPKVMHVITGLGVGGAEKILSSLAHDYPGSQSLPVINISGLNDLASVAEVRFSQFRPEAKTVLGLIGLLFRARSLMIEHDIRIVHAHMFHAMLFVCLLKVLCLFRIRIVFTPHTTRFSRFRRVLIRCCKPFRARDVLFSPALMGEKMLVSRSVVIRNGVDIQENVCRPDANPHHPFRLIHVGRFFEPKNHLALVDVAQELHAIQGRDIEVWLIGDGPLQAQVRQKVAALGLSGCVHFLGLRANVAELLAQADCFVLPSLWEGLPVSLLEAGAAGLPVVSTPVGDIPTLFSADELILCGVDDFASALSRIIDDYPTALVMAGRLRQHILSKFTSSAMVAAYGEVYVAVASE